VACVCCVILHSSDHWLTAYGKGLWTARLRLCLTKKPVSTSKIGLN
jgi:hypothetical protein